jgi:RNA polymerase sigma-70 factor (ECF subfamily)
VLAYALRRSDPATAEEVVSEVFLVAWRRPDRIPALEPVLWLYAVARRVLANQRRATRRRAALTIALGAAARTRHAGEPTPSGALLEALLALRPLIARSSR